MENYRKLKPRMRRFAEAIVEGKTAGEAALIVRPESRAPRKLGWKLKQIPRVAAAIAELEAATMEEAGITRLGVLRRMNAVADRCMQAEPVRDRKGEPIEGEYTFDSAGANRALENLAKYGLRIPDRTEITGRDGGPIKSETNAPSLADFYNTVTRIAVDEPPPAASTPTPANGTD